MGASHIYSFTSFDYYSGKLTFNLSFLDGRETETEEEGVREREVGGREREVGREREGGGREEGTEGKEREGGGREEGAEGREREVGRERRR